LERVVISIIINKKLKSCTERSDVFEWFRDLTERQLTEVAQNGSLRKLQHLFLGGNTNTVRTVRYLPEVSIGDTGSSQGILVLVLIGETSHNIEGNRLCDND
jgi:hypothetical protein